MKQLRVSLDHTTAILLFAAANAPQMTLAESLNYDALENLRAAFSYTIAGRKIPGHMYSGKQIQIAISYPAAILISHAAHMYSSNCRLSDIFSDDACQQLATAVGRSIWGPSFTPQLAVVDSGAQQLGATQQSMLPGERQNALPQSTYELEIRA